MLLSDYIDVGKYFEDSGVFDPVLDNDNVFFINILRLKTAKTHEFQVVLELWEGYYAKFSGI